MRRTRLLLGIGAACVVLGAMLVWLLLDVNRYSGVIQAQLEQQLGRKVTLGRLGLRLLPLRFQVASPEIAEDPGFGDTSPFLRAENLDVQVALWPLLSGDVQIQSLELERPAVELIKNSAGVWNYSTMGPEPSAQPAEASMGATRSTAFALNRMTIRDGQIAVTDQKGVRSVYDHIDLTLENYAEGQPFSFDLLAHTPGEGAQEIRLSGRAGPLATNLIDTPFDGMLNLNEVGIEGLKTFLNTTSFPKAQGSLSGEAKLTNDSGVLQTAGAINVSDLRINDVPAGYPIDLRYDVGSRLAEGIVTINSATIQLGPTPLSLDGSINTATTPVTLDVNIKSGDVSISEIARLASAFGVAFAPGTDVAGRLRTDVQIRGTTLKPSLRGTIAGSDLRISGNGMPLPVDVKAINLSLSPSEIRSNEFSATAGQTAVNARFAVRQYTSATPGIDVAMKAPNATLPEIQSIARAYGITGLDHLKGEGGLNLDLNASGSTQSLSSAEVMKAFNGKVTLDFSPLRMSGVDVPKELAAIGGFNLNSAPQDFTDIVRLMGNIVIEKGIARSNDLQLQMAIGKLVGGGTADLSSQALNLKLSAVLTKASSDRVGSTRIGGYMNTVLSNSGGELVIPVIVTGTMTQPQFSPDVQAFVEMQRKKLLPTFDNPRAAVSGVLGALTAPRAGSPEQNNAQQPASGGQRPADALKGVLDGFLGRRKAPEQPAEGK